MNKVSIQTIANALACQNGSCVCHRRPGNGKIITHCPAHNDQNPSLCIEESSEGKVLVYCQAGCLQESVIAALRGKGLWSGIGGEGGIYIPLESPATVQPSRGCTLKQYSESKLLSIDFLKNSGLSDMSYLGSPAVRIPYINEEGQEDAVRFRLALEGDNRLRWRKGAKICLYGLSQLSQAHNAKYVTICEGESDVQTLWYNGFPALGVPGASNWRDDRDAMYLDNIPVIYVVVEPDQGGQTVLRWLTNSCIRDRVRLVNLGIHKDPSGLYLADPERFKWWWTVALAEAIPWSQYEAAELRAQTYEAWSTCETLANEPDILKIFIEDLNRYGVVGEDRAVKLLYLALTSRLLDRPVSVAVKGPSTGGKSYLVDSVLRFFPSSAAYVLSAMSERALVYSEEPLSHRYLVLIEAAGFQGDFSSYLMRSLLSEGCLRYETVDKTKDGLKPRLIQRDGPTGLIVTTTAVKLHPENETRLLSIPVTDTQEQTRNILAVLASEQQREQTNLKEWHALQQWLEGAEHRVHIPYARKLAELVPPVAIRLRRDFETIQNLIRTHAVLHQANRERDSEGRIIATLEDYAAVRELVADLVSDGIEATVSATVRETVKAVKDIVADGHTEVTVAQVKDRINLDKSTAYRRVQVAIEHGYLKNLEDKKGRPACLVIADLMPDDQEILPEPDRLQGCTVAVKTEGINIPPSPSIVGAQKKFRFVDEDVLEV